MGPCSFCGSTEHAEGGCNTGSEAPVILAEDELAKARSVFPTPGGVEWFWGRVEDTEGRVGVTLTIFHDTGETTVFMSTDGLRRLLMQGLNLQEAIASETHLEIATELPEGGTR